MKTFKGFLMGFLFCFILIIWLPELDKPNDHLKGRVIKTNLFPNQIKYCYTLIEINSDTLEVLDFNFKRKENEIVVLRLSNKNEYYLPFDKENL